MKRQLLLLILFVSSVQITFASFTTANWRWRNDDGTETTATWKAAENTPIEIVDINTTIRLRVEFVNNTQQRANYSSMLSYSINDANGVNSKVIFETGNGYGDEHFTLVSVTNVSDLSPTTKQLAGHSSFSSYPFKPGSVVSNSGVVPYDIEVGEKTEYEFVIKPKAGILRGQTYYFINSYGTTVTGGSRPYLTVSAALPVKLKDFSAQKKNNGVALTWQTESETNNNRFEVERSSDGKKWNVITKVLGKGTAAAYQYQDTRPTTGKNYYRLAQYDNDGTLTHSGLQVVDFAINNTLVNIYPNPTTQKLTIALPNFKGKTVTVKVNDLQGKLIAQTVNEVTDQLVNYVLPNGTAKGIYIINLTGDGFNYSQKIIVR